MTNKKVLYTNLLSLVPICHTSDKSYLDALKTAFGKFVSFVEQTDDSEFTKGKASILSEVNKMYANIELAITYTYKGDHSSAFNAVDKALYDKGICFREFQSGKDYDFYRMRTVEEGKLFQRKELFHIPFSKRGLVSTQRYSMPGLPCLYLGFSLHACWEEMHRKPISNFAFSRFHLQKNMKVMSLDFPDYSRWCQDFEKIILLFPMIMACMVAVDNYKNPFKSEYIIPQLLMEWITTHPNTDVDGICYTSVHLDKQFEFPLSTFSNIALPATDFEGSDYSKRLQEMFLLTEATTEEVERVKIGSFISMYEVPENDDTDAVLRENYRSSLFGMLEGIIAGHKLGKFED